MYQKQVLFQVYVNFSDSENSLVTFSDRITALTTTILRTEFSHSGFFAYIFMQAFQTVPLEYPTYKTRCRRHFDYFWTCFEHLNSQKCDIFFSRQSAAFSTSSEEASWTCWHNVELCFLMKIISL